jgi:hypothetical protein
VGVTLEIHAHLAEDAQNAATEAMDRLLRKPAGQPKPAISNLGS